MTVSIQTVKKNDDLKAKLVNSASYIHNIAEFDRQGNLKTIISCCGLFFLIVGSALIHYEYIPINWYVLAVVAVIFLVAICIAYVSLTGVDFNQFATDFFNENQQVIEDSFLDGLKSVDELYTDSSLDNPIRVKGCDADIISFSKEINRDRMVVYCIFKIEGVAIRVKKIVRLSKRGEGHQFGELIISNYQVSRLSSDDLVSEYKNSPNIYQEHFASCV